VSEFADWAKRTQAQRKRMFKIKKRKKYDTAYACDVRHTLVEFMIRKYL
jgi:hypothetical protein